MQAILLDGYVQVEPELRLPKALQAAEDHVRRHDPELRLRQALKPELRQQGCGFILERKARRQAVTHTETRYDLAGDMTHQADPDVRVASRDGYHVINNGVHISYLMRPEAITESLAEGDLEKQRWEERWEQLMTEAADAKVARRKFRMGESEHHARESFDILDRLGDSHGTERTRITNAGGVETFNVTDRRRITLTDPETPSAGEIPA